MRRIALILMVASAPALGQVNAIQNGNKLYSYMTSSELTLRTYAEGYAAGIADASGGIFAVMGYRFCMPISVTDVRLSDIVRLWLERHPEQRHYAASALVVQALSRSLPLRALNQGLVTHPPRETPCLPASLRPCRPPISPRLRPLA